jgi:uncharacterized repeat protein (TIGR01451 family)
MKKILFTIVFSVIALLGATSVDAQYGCPPYGAECPPASKIVVDKTIRDPRAKGDVYVDNLTIADYKFAPGEDVIFKITIKNTSDQNIENVEAIDTIPVLNDVLLASGSTRSELREINKPFGTLSAGETKTWFIRTRVKEADSIPAGTVCGDPKAINRIRVRANGMPDAFDTSSFCIQKSVMGATKQPESGSEMVLIAGGLMALTAFGFFGNKYSHLISR